MLRTMMLGLFLVCATLGLGACGDDESDCDKACNKQQSCGVSSASCNTASSSSCSGDALCTAGCVNRASCAELKSPAGTTYASCVTECSGGASLE
ncbi:MAG: hypothetical protein IPG96_13485 [Proteobacteria bacterium]|nr:hypothetical protein [Pseudomonadota bacterium]